MSDDDDYEVGYGKPPKHSRWEKGQSGNPKGRPKGSRGLKSDLDRVLRKVLTIEGRGTTLKGTTQLLALEMLARRAATGDVRSIKSLIDLILTVFGPGDRGGDRERLSDRDQKLFDNWIASLGDETGESAAASGNEHRNEASLHGSPQSADGPETDDCSEPECIDGEKDDDA